LTEGATAADSHAHDAPAGSLVLAASRRAAVADARAREAGDVARALWRAAAGAAEAAEAAEAEAATAAWAGGTDRGGRPGSLREADAGRAVSPPAGPAPGRAPPPPPPPKAPPPRGLTEAELRRLGGLPPCPVIPAEKCRGDDAAGAADADPDADGHGRAEGDAAPPRPPPPPPPRPPPTGPLRWGPPEPAAGPDADANAADAADSNATGPGPAGDRPPPRRLACGHCYHRRCVDAWLRLQSSCPECRATVRAPPPTTDDDENGDDGDGALSPAADDDDGDDDALSPTVMDLLRPFL